MTHAISQNIELDDAEIFHDQTHANNHISGEAPKQLQALNQHDGQSASNLDDGGRESRDSENEMQVNI